MKEIVTESARTVDRTENITDLLEHQVVADRNRALFARQTSPGEWTDISSATFQAEVKELARALAGIGIAPGDRVGIMSATRYEWTLADFAIWYAGAVTVPIYETSSPSQVAWILEDSGIKAVLAENATHQQVVERAVRQENLDPLVGIWLFDENLDDLRAHSQEGPDAEEMERRRNIATLEDLATVIYTSGTTGKPKGCELTHGNFSELSQQVLSTELGDVVRPGHSTVLFIPLAHVFARFIAVIAVAGGARVGHTANIKQLVPDLQSFKPDFLLAVPRVFEKVYNAAKMKADDSGRGKIFEAGAQTAVDYSTALQDGKVPLGLKLKHALFDKLLYNKIKDAMGGRVTHAVSGGGPLGARLGHFFRGVGVTILEGYGLTETTAPVTVNLPSELRIGSVGRPIPGNAIKIADDGEVLAKGVSVMRGYRNRPDLADSTFTDGWFATGDLGELDEDGYLSITGRKKELIVTAGGKNVSPSQLEDVLRSDVLISQAIVIGDQRPFVAALVTIDEETAPDWLRQHKLDPEMSIKEMSQHPDIIAHVQTLVDKANDTVSRAESIREFRITTEDFTVESGQMTPSLKIKREVVTRDYENLIEEIYAKPKPKTS
ncbi:AMP-dependent synthetase/ligase [Auritidibacter ignavus]|uniref:AMP-dependent synthetase/ligase n=1 Tax=Auritidibacter ignavus TaxID=678932 RepID=UPI00244ADB8B|nr:AMP-dependent synthetase/ligase [Auritidibacter ignavus]WGH84626.1 AMP-dependent synthetase/ligase [Auritidibacter ignavus]WGH86936.1 AMP-dependent synthetase/ligase [Auritidibacter ignavus]WGH89221.1 AMP-dependent synthetase/ligase [Auritidibacter ignavus]